MTNEEETKIDEVAAKLCVIAQRIQHKEQLRDDAIASAFIRAFEMWVHVLAPRHAIKEIIKATGETLIFSAAQNEKGKMQ